MLDAAKSQKGEVWPLSINEFSSSRLAVEARGLVKVYAKTRAVDGIDLTVPAGIVYGVLGPNGAGKTTTIRMLATLLRPDAGSARVLGHDILREPEAVRRKVSLTGQFASIDEDLTGLENLILITRLLGYPWKQAKSRAELLLEAFGLTEASHRQVKTFSGGMRRRIDIAASLAVPPQLLFLDEPTTGLDPRSRNQVWEIVRALVREGTTVVLTTQYLEEADQLANRLVVIDHGKVIAEGSSSELKMSVGSSSFHLKLARSEDHDRARLMLSHRLGAPIQQGTDPTEISARVEEPETATQLLVELMNAGIPYTSFSLGQPSLDEVFLALTGHPAEEQSVSNEEDIS